MFVGFGVIFVVGSGFFEKKFIILVLEFLLVDGWDCFLWCLDFGLMFLFDIVVGFEWFSLVNVVKVYEV